MLKMHLRTACIHAQVVQTYTRTSIHMLTRHGLDFINCSYISLLLFGAPRTGLVHGLRAPGNIDLGSCQNYGPFWIPYIFGAVLIIVRTPKIRYP